MTVRSIEIQFVTCDSCGELGPRVEDNDHGPRVDGLAAQMAAQEVGWALLGDGQDRCPHCTEIANAMHGDTA